MNLTPAEAAVPDWARGLSADEWGNDDEDDEARRRAGRRRSGRQDPRGGTPRRP